MTVPFAAVVTPDSIVFTAPGGKTHTIASTQGGFDMARGLVRRIQQARQSQKDGLETGENPDALIGLLVAVASPAQTINATGQGRVVVSDGVVRYDGAPVNNALTQRILWGIGEGYDMTPYMAFLDLVMDNPSKRAIEELWSFIERHKMGITDDGHLLAYKRVRTDFHDIYSGKFDNSPGLLVEMPRRDVDDNPNRTCSTGLHVCSQTYLPQYGLGEGRTVVIVKISPADVVSVPYDYIGKMRVCRYHVLGEYSQADKDDLLASKPVFTSREFRPPEQPHGSEPSPIARDPDAPNEGFKVGDQVESDDPDFPGKYLVADVDEDGMISFDHQSYYDAEDFRLVSRDGAQLDPATDASIGVPATIADINAALEPAPNADQPEELDADADPAGPVSEAETPAFSVGQQVFYYPEDDTIVSGPFVVAKADNGMLFVMDPSAVSDGFSAPARLFKATEVVQAAPESVQTIEAEPAPEPQPTLPAAPSPTPSPPPAAPKTAPLNRLIDLIRRR